MSTRQAIRYLVAPHLDGAVGTIGSGSATTAVLTELIGAGADDNEYLGALLVMPDAATAADRMRIVTVWAASTGTATFATRADTTYTSETFEIYRQRNGVTLANINAAINDALKTTRRTVVSTFPMLTGSDRYPLRDLSWIRNREDIDGVTVRTSPNLIDNSNLALWGSGTSSAPTRWTLAGSGGTIARANPIVGMGDYSLTITRVGTDVTLTYSLSLQAAAHLRSKSVAFGAWLAASVASRGYVAISDGLTTTTSSAHSGTSLEPEFIETTMTLSALALRCDFILTVKTGDTAVKFENPVANIGTTVNTTLKDYGDQDSSEHEVNAESYNDAIVMRGGEGNQLVVRSAMPYAELSSDTASTDCPDAVAMHGALYQFALKHREGETRDLADRLLAIHGPAYSSLARGLRERPQPNRGARVLISGSW